MLKRAVFIQILDHNVSPKKCFFGVYKTNLSRFFYISNFTKTNE